MPMTVSVPPGVRFVVEDGQHAAPDAEGVPSAGVRDYGEPEAGAEQQESDRQGAEDANPPSRSWFVDTVVPTGTISINGGASSTTSRSVTLKLSASDPSPASGVADMRFRNGGTTTWSSWEAYSTSKSWTLTSGAGTKTVYVQYRDRAGNISATASDTIRYSR